MNRPRLITLLYRLHLWLSCFLQYCIGRLQSYGMQDFNGTHKTRDAPALEKSLRGVLHTVKEAEEHIRYSRPKLQIINKGSHLVSNLISAHQPSDLSPDCIMPVTMYSQLSEIMIVLTAAVCLSRRYGSHRTMLLPVDMHLHQDPECSASTCCISYADLVF